MERDERELPEAGTENAPKPSFDATSRSFSITPVAPQSRRNAFPSTACAVKAFLSWLRAAAYGAKPLPFGRSVGDEPSWIRFSPHGELHAGLIAHLTFFHARYLWAFNRRSVSRRPADFQSAQAGAAPARRTKQKSLHAVCRVLHCGRTMVKDTGTSLSNSSGRKAGPRTDRSSYALRLESAGMGPNPHARVSFSAPVGKSGKVARLRAGSSAGSSPAGSTTKYIPYARRPAMTL